MKRSFKLISSLITAVLALALLCFPAFAQEDERAYSVRGYYEEDGIYRLEFSGMCKTELDSFARETEQDANARGVLMLKFDSVTKLTAVFSAASAEAELCFAVIGKESGNIPLAGAQMYDANGKYGIIITLDPHDAAQRSVISKLFKFSTVKKGAFYLVKSEGGKTVYSSCFDGSSDVYGYKGVIEASWANEIPNRKSFLDLTIADISPREYTGSPIRPKLKITDSLYRLEKNVDYEVSYRDNTEIGLASVVVDFIGRYEGSVTLTFLIYPSKTTLTAERTEEGILLSWEKVEGIDKYRIFYSEEGKKFKGLKTVSADVTETLSASLDPEKTYWFMMTSYKISDGKKYSAEYSNVVKLIAESETEPVQEYVPIILPI